MDRPTLISWRSRTRITVKLGFVALAVGTMGTTAAIPARAAAIAHAALTHTLAAPTAISVNTVNWSGRADFGSRSPRWYTDGSGIVHLQGAATQINNTGPGANLIGTLPLSARPNHNVFTIVHTFAGTYADLAIGTNGHIDLINPRPPAVKDYTFVSLEGITYRR
jgi:hypothetical protein